MLKKITTGVFVAAIFVVNIILIYPYLSQSSPGWVESIEVSFITMGRWFAQNFPHIWWNPYWYAGFPMRFSYVPLIPVLTALGGFLMNDFGRAYHIISGISYALAPISLYFLLKYITKDGISALLGSLAFSLITPLSSVFNYAKEAQGLFPQGTHLPPWRLMAMVIWGEGPHSLSLVFLPLAALFYIRAIDEKRYRYIILASLFTALTALSNAIGLWGLGVFMLCILIVFLIWRSDKKDTILTTLWVVVFSFLFTAFWYTPGFIKNEYFKEGGGLISGFLSYFPWGVLGAFILITVLLVVLKKLIKSPFIASIILWFIATFSIVFIFYQYNISLAPQARRYITEVDMAQTGILAIVVASISNIIRKKIHKYLGYGFSVLFLLFLVVATYGTWGASSYFASYNDEAKTNFVERNMNEYLSSVVGSNERVFTSANYTFWLNFQTDIWQIRGGHWQASINPLQADAEYQIVNGEDATTSLDWLKIFGISYLVVNLPGSTINYNDYQYPLKFEPLLGTGEAVKLPTEVVYKVPLQPGLVSTVNMSGQTRITPPANGADKTSLDNYLSWINSGRSLNLKTISNDRYEIAGDVQNGEGIHLAFNYWTGFSAQDSFGNKLKISRDPFGFILITPKAYGEQTITLTYGPTLDLYFGIFLFAAGIILAVFIKKAFSYDSR